MKRIILITISISLLLSLIGCKKEQEQEPETAPKYTDPTMISYVDYDHFYVDLKASQKDFSSVMFLLNDSRQYTYIPKTPISDFLVSIKVTPYWFLYYFDIPLVSGPYFQVWVHRTEESIAGAKEVGCIGSNQKYTYFDEELKDIWYVMLDEHYIARISFDKELGVTTYEKLTEYIIFEKFDQFDFRTPEKAVENIDSYIGASYKELNYAFLGKESFQYANFVFIKATDKKNVVAELDSEHKNAVDIHAYRSVSPSHEAFEEITVGMSVFDVVERVGIPFGSFTHGISSLDFKASDGSVYRIIWDADMNVSEVTKFS